MEAFFHEKIEFEEQSPVYLLLHQQNVNYVILEHWHRSLEIDYIIDCSMELSINGERSFINPGNLVLINSGDIHSIVPSMIEETEENKLHAATIFISYEVLKSICPEIDQISFDLNRNPEKQEELKAVYQEMLQVKLSPAGEYENLLMTSLLYKMCYLLFAYFKVEKSKEVVNSQKYIERVRKVLDYLDTHYQEPLTLQEVADQFYVSMEYLSRVLKKYTGKTFKEYLNKVRLMKAFEELVQTDYTILELALRNGFSDVRTFIRLFKEQYDLTPLQYRKKNPRKAVTDELIGDAPHIRKMKETY